MSELSTARVRDTGFGVLWVCERAGSLLCPRVMGIMGNRGSYGYFVKEGVVKERDIFGGGASALSPAPLLAARRAGMFSPDGQLLCSKRNAIVQRR